MKIQITLPQLSHSMIIKVYMLLKNVDGNSAANCPWKCNVKKYCNLNWATQRGQTIEVTVILSRPFVPSLQRTHRLLAKKRCDIQGVKKNCRKTVITAIMMKRRKIIQTLKDCSYNVSCYVVLFMLAYQRTGPC